MNIDKLREFTSHISFSIFGQNLYLISDYDKKFGKRVFLQVYYNAPCTKTGRIDKWKGRKQYLSPHMTEDEILKTAYRLFKDAVEHEVMEGFKFDQTIVFNPHVNFRKLIEVSPHEVSRDTIPPFDV